MNKSKEEGNTNKTISNENSKYVKFEKVITKLQANVRKYIQLKKYN